MHTSRLMTGAPNITDAPDINQTVNFNFEPSLRSSKPLLSLTTGFIYILQGLNMVSRL